jgi:hypothetical protein
MTYFLYTRDIGNNTNQGLKTPKLQKTTVHDKNSTAGVYRTPVQHGWITARVGAYEHSPRGVQAGRAANVRGARAGKAH